jgi:hypothetical protein
MWLAMGIHTKPVLVCPVLQRNGVDALEKLIQFFHSSPETFYHVPQSLEDGSFNKTQIFGPVMVSHTLKNLLQISMV